jgi:hypothetical protein
MKGNEMTNVRHMTSAKAYATRSAELAQLLQACIDQQRANGIDAQQAHWGNVGDMTHRVALVEELLLSINNRMC